MVAISDCARLVGYARVSTQDQNLSLQIDALLRAGVSKDLIYTDKASGAKNQRPGLDACLEQLRSGDVLLVWRLDRLGRSVRHLVTLIDELRERQIGFRSVCDGAVDTTTPSGELIFHVFSALAQFERRLIQERTNAGLAAARARGHKGGRPPIKPNDRRIVLANKLFQDKSISLDDICATLKISKSTLYRYIVIGGGYPPSLKKRQSLQGPSDAS
jgi:DNA invertase Pin-like site-specific DNA recombinase